jgi:hypothetical protein
VQWTTTTQATGSVTAMAVNEILRIVPQADAWLFERHRRDLEFAVLFDLAARDKEAKATHRSFVSWITWRPLAPRRPRTRPRARAPSRPAARAALRARGGPVGCRNFHRAES